MWYWQNNHSNGRSWIKNDRFRRLLAEAKSKAGDNSKIKWIEADCTNFDLKQKFDLIFMTGNSLQHLHLSNQVLAFFSCVNRHLDIGGVFAFDVFLPSLKILSRDSSISFPVLKYKNIEDLEISLNEQNYYNSHTQVNTINWNHLDSSGTILKNDTLEMRQFFPKELDLLVELGGFSIEQKYGNWNLEPDGPDDFKQIMVLKAK